MVTNVYDYTGKYEKKLKAVYEIDLSRLRELYNKIIDHNERKVDCFRINKGIIEINGKYVREEDGKICISLFCIGRLVAGEDIGKNVNGAYIEIYEYDVFKGLRPRPNLEEIAKEFIVQ